MPSGKKKISLFVVVVAVLLAVGLIPLLLTGWILSDKSGRELRASENRYQIQLVQDKARQIEMYGKRFTSIVSGLATAIELNSDTKVITSVDTEKKLALTLKENSDLLALTILRSNTPPLTVFRPGGLSRDEIERIAVNTINSGNVADVVVGPPQKAGDGFVMTFSRSVSLPEEGDIQIIAVSSLHAISNSLVGGSRTSEEQLWTAGLPIVLVIDRNGNAVFHPDPQIVSNAKPMNDLKIVQEWLDQGVQVQSALVPFTASYNGVEHEMIGAYSTAQMGTGSTFGVITMQDERTALASVAEMRTQTWIISIAFALLAVIVGLISSRYLTSPLRRLISASKLIAEGDFSGRVETNNVTELGTLGESFNLMTDKVEEQIVNLANAASENRELFVGTVKALAAAIDGKDKYTRGHSERVSRISVAMGKRLGMTDEELDTLRMAALLHDIGKIGIDDSILKKPAALTDEEYTIMKTHPQRGYKIMSQIPAMKDFLPAMYMHHEMVNGQGYPQGLSGDQIPLQAKIVSVADTFDAMTIDRPYSKGMELQPALERLRTFIGTRYQADVVEALVDACDAGEVGNGIVRQRAEKRAAAAVAEVQLELPNVPEFETEDEEILELSLA